ncbi:MAG TPA: ABC transporter permease [Victivallales bacterium]|nr:ABC transporter permease [Victivallales bacterium]
MNIYEYFRIYKTIVKKECERIFSIWPQTILPSAITMTLYFLIFGKIVGSKVGEMSGLSYIEFITPGLIIMAAINNSYTNVVSSFFGERWNRSIEEILVSPVSNHSIILGFISGGIIRGFIVGILVCIVAGFFGAFHIYNIFLAIVGLIFCSGLFALGGLINGIFSQKFDDTMIISTFILTPLTYLGGVFFSLKVLPPFWRNLAMFNPIYYIVDFFRYACLGQHTVSPYDSFTAVIIFSIILYIFTYYCLKKGIRIKE